MVKTISDVFEGFKSNLQKSLFKGFYELRIDEVSKSNKHFNRIGLFGLSQKNVIYGFLKDKHTGGLNSVVYGTLEKIVEKKVVVASIYEKFNESSEIMQYCLRKFIIEDDIEGFYGGYWVGRKQENSFEVADYEVIKKGLNDSLYISGLSRVKATLKTVVLEYYNFINYFNF